MNSEYYSEVCLLLDDVYLSYKSLVEDMQRLEHLGYKADVEELNAAVSKIGNLHSRLVDKVVKKKKG